MIELLVCDTETSAGIEVEGLRWHLILPDGRVRSKVGDFILNAEGAALLIEGFERHRAQIPVDWEHGTLGGEYQPPPGRVGAAGWIHKLKYERGQGLLAGVVWLRQGWQDVQAGSFGYFSPVVAVRTKDRVAVGLHSVALTNKPAIERMERIAAAMGLNDWVSSLKESNAMDGEKDKNKKVDEPAAVEQVVAAETTGTGGPTGGASPGAGITPGGGAAGGATTGGGGSAAAEAAAGNLPFGPAIYQGLAKLFGLPEEATLEQIRAAMINFLEKTGETGEPAAPSEGAGGGGGEENLAASLRTIYGLAASAEVQTIVNKAKEEHEHKGFVPVGQHNELAQRVNAMETAQREKRAEELLAAAVKANKVPHPDSDAYKHWEAKAKADPDAFEADMEHIVASVPPGRTVPPDGTGQGGRATIIATARSEYEAEPMKVGTLQANVNVALKDKGHKPLTKDEIEKLVA